MRIDADLSEPERAVWDAFPRAETIDLRTGDPARDDPATSGTWDRGRAVRADVLAALVLGARTCARHQDRVLASARTGPQLAVQRVTRRNWSSLCRVRARVTRRSGRRPVGWGRPHDVTLNRVICVRLRGDPGSRADAWIAEESEAVVESSFCRSSRARLAPAESEIEEEPGYRQLIGWMPGWFLDGLPQPVPGSALDALTVVKMIIMGPLFGGTGRLRRAVLYQADAQPLCKEGACLTGQALTGW
jgi:hypothetical protein